MIQFRLTIVLLLFAGLLFGQDMRIANTSNPLSTVKAIEMPTVDNATLKAKELERRAKREIPEFATGFDTNIQAETHGSWERLPNGDWLWRVRIHSQKAHSLNLGFTEYVMPKGGTMILYSEDGRDVQGPFTPADNEEHEQLWTPIVAGDALVVELRLPAEGRKALRLKIGSVNHDFMDLGNFSGSCNVDVICGLEDGFPEIDEYRDIIQAVGMYAYSGRRQCTGFLVNNTRQDCRPLFLTANHCQVRAGNVSSVVVYWNFENTTCREPNSQASGRLGDGPTDDFNSGARIVAAYEPSDMMLLELDDPISSTANAFFAGWNWDEPTPTSAIAIHHPNTEEKRISFENDATYIGEWGAGPARLPNGDHIIVPDWDLGTTEGGSSGSPLFDQDKFVVGQLHGGAAGCGNDAYDSYGWIRTSWEGGGAPSSRLKDWLDPDDLGVVRLVGNWQGDCGRRVGIDMPVQEICLSDTASFELLVNDDFEGDVALSLDGLPIEFMSNFSQDTVQAGDTVRLTVFSTIVTDVMNFTLVAADSVRTARQSLSLKVFSDSLEQIALLAPMDSLNGAPDIPAFEWEAHPTSANYVFQLSTDSTFTIAVGEVELSDPAYTPDTTLLSSTTYYWRVRANNPCGEGEWSMIFSFSTGDCFTVLAGDLPIRISDGPAGDYISELIIDEVGEIIDLNVVDLRIDHTWVSDLQANLTSPTGETVRLFDQICGDSKNIDLGFDDQSTLDQLACPPNDGRSYQPDEAWSLFNGENATGVWELEVRDQQTIDGGNFNNWGLRICRILPTVDASLKANETEFNICEDESIELQLQLGEVFDSTTQITVEDLSEGLIFTVDSLSEGLLASISLSAFGDLSEGRNFIRFQADNGDFQAFETIIVNLVKNPAVATLRIPADGTDNLALSGNLTWTGSDNTMGYIVDLATDSLFSNIIQSDSTMRESSRYEDLEFMTIYYWRVYSSNECGMVLSETRSFTTTPMTAVATLPTESIQIAPNPSDGQLSIQFDLANSDDLWLTVLSIDGKVLLEERIAPQQKRKDIDLRTQGTGVYLLRIRNAQGVLTKRIVVQ